MTDAASVAIPAVDRAPFDDTAFLGRRRLADRVYRGALFFNVALTILWLVMLLAGGRAPGFGEYRFGLAELGRIGMGVLFFYVLWGFVWYGVKTLLLATFVGFSAEDRKRAFSSRMQEPFDVSEFTGRYSERRIRITDMIGRRGRFITLACAGFYYLYTRVAADPTSSFLTNGMQDNLFDAVVTSWIFLAFFYRNGLLAATFYGPQSRVMDGVLARANCLLISTLWLAFKFIMVPLSGALAATYPRHLLAMMFALIWGSYIVADTLAEVGGSLFGKQRLRVWGIGDVNRKSVGGTVTAFVGTLVFASWIVLASGQPASWLVLAFLIATSSTALELFSPRGTDDVLMATGNALICLAFGAFV